MKLNNRYVPERNTTPPDAKKGDQALQPQNSENGYEIIGKE